MFSQKKKKEKKRKKGGNFRFNMFLISRPKLADRPPDDTEA